MPFKQLPLTVGAIVEKVATSSFARCGSGVVAVEFAFVVPILLCLYLGAFEASQAIEAKRKVEMTAAAIADLVARCTLMTDQHLENILNISSAIMVPFPLDRLEITVTAVRIDPNGQGTRDWSRSSKSTTTTFGGPHLVPSTLRRGEEDYVVIASVQYSYKGITGYLDAFDAFSFEAVNYVRPRTARKIKYERGLD